jgi:hypothetical protein
MKLAQKAIMLTMVLVMAMTAIAAVPEVTQVTYLPSPAVPGTTITVFVQLENLDAVTQKNVLVNVDNIYPFTVKPTSEMQNPANIGAIDAYGKAQAQFIVYVDPTAENKTYTLPVTVKTDTNQATGKKTDAQIVVSGKEPVIKVVSTSNEKLLPGQEKEITFTLQNVGTGPAYDVTLEMTEDRTVTATGAVVERDITPLGAATGYITNIFPGEQKQVSLRVSVANTATIKNYTIPMEVSFRNASGTRTASTSIVGLKVFGAADLDITLKEKTGMIAAGQSADITLEIFNKGLGKTEFTVIEVKAEDASIEKPKQFIGSLGPNDVDTIKTKITFNKSGDQMVEATITYQDADATTKTKTIQIPLKADMVTGEGPNLLLIAIVLIVIGFLVWNFVLKRRKK